ncbi:MAG: isoprenylcysteine carboxylmethyltransferase family protein [Planctomycetes bacterium]|nr:isoprenylcysteine carboxylmethyltransferase family protein [Planctomycetota bacterium]
MIDENVYRWVLLAILVSGAGVSIYFRRKGAKSGGPISPRDNGLAIDTLLSLFGFGAMASVVTYLINPKWMAWSQLELVPQLRLLGGLLGLIALALLFWTLRHLGANVTRTARTRSHHTLVTGGPYRWARHPLYSSGVVLCAAYVLLTANWFILLMCGLASAVLRARTSREEANLIKKFGDDYRAYMKRTGRFLPRLRAS